MKKIFDQFYGNFVLYSPGVDRVIAVTNGDPQCAMTSAQILSSKLPLVVGLVKQLEINADNCLEYSIKDKNIMFAFSSIFYGRQWPGFKRLNKGVVYQGWPLDYQNERSRAVLKNLSEYADFVCDAVKAIRITNIIFNVLPLETLTEEMIGWDDVPPGIVPEPDQSNSDIGISRELLQILYRANNIDEACELFKEFWLRTPDTVLYRNQFYQMLGLDMPQELKRVTFSGNITGFAV
jgi:hypothetical protein